MSNRTKLVWEPGAVNDLARLREFLQSKNPKAAFNAAQRIINTANLLLDNPHLGRPIEEFPEFNEIFIPFGQRGYVMRYCVDGKKIVILRVWHGREDR